MHQVHLGGKSRVIKRIVMMDRSWYNRAGVERVMGYCTQTQYFEFMREVPDLERILVNSGIKLIKFSLPHLGLEFGFRCA